MFRLRFSCFSIVLALLAFCVTSVQAADALPLVDNVELQPLQAQVKRVAQALELAGAPLSAKRQAALKAALAETDNAKGIKAIQAIFDPLCLAGVHISAESRVKVAPGAAPRQLIQQGWRVFLVKVNNKAGVTAPLRCTSPNAAPVYKRSSNSPSPKLTVKPNQVPNRWLDVHVNRRQPMNKNLSGLELEYRILELYSRDAGKREAKLLFDVGQGTQDLGFRNELNVLFECQPAVKVIFEVIDHDGKPTTGQFVIRDQQGRIYPSRSRRLEPDFFFHSQIYRHHGEPVFLPPGKYNVEFSRGPEYIISHRQITVPNRKQHRERFRLTRWIKLADVGWFSGDHHIHAAGCAHYESPTEGVTPEAMMRHILGEDLNIGCVLSWGPCWYYQKQFFEGKVSDLSTPRYKMRYDVEVSGFPSSHAGHLCLLRLKEDDYPGTTKINEWPSWNLPILAWGKKQGGVVGYSHSGWGLQVKSTKLPNYEMPPYNGIGANEYIVDVTHDVCDFISTVDTPSVWELNIWYHTLNCGYTCRISGETDFPCIYGERVGLGRIYVKLDKDKPLNFDAWVEGLRDGRSYCGDGLSHLYDFSVNGLGVGEQGDGGRASFLAIKAGEKLNVKVRAAAMLAKKPRDDIRRRPLDQKPYWHVERARIGNTRKVPVELIVNGRSVARKEIDASGSISDVTFDYTPKQSSWLALRIYPTAHTNPVFVEVDGKPIRASKKSAQWCLDGVDVCWKQKAPRMRKEDLQDAKKAYDFARAAYRKILKESHAD